MGCKGGVVVLLGIEASGCAELIPHRREQRITDHRSVPCSCSPVLTHSHSNTLDRSGPDSHTLSLTHSHSNQSGKTTALHCTSGREHPGGGPRLSSSSLTTHYSLPVVTTSKPSLPSPTSRYRSSTWSACCAAKPLPNTDGYLYGARLGNANT